MYATMTTTHGTTTEDNAAVAEMVGETMVEWLRDIEGFGGLLMLNNAETGVTQVIALWESEELAERHHEARMRLRDRVTATVEPSRSMYARSRWWRRCRTTSRSRTSGARATSSSSRADTAELRVDVAGAA